MLLNGIGLGNSRSLTAVSLPGHSITCSTVTVMLFGTARS
jgi:hypothetical protein